MVYIVAAPIRSNRNKPYFIKILIAGNFSGCINETMNNAIPNTTIVGTKIIEILAM